MKIRTLLTIIVKLIGISLIHQLFSIIVASITFSGIMIKAGYATNMWFMAGMPVALTVVIFLSYLFIFKSDLVVRKLQINKGFDDEIIPLDIPLRTIFSIAIIFIGGVMLTEGVPELLRVAYYFLKSTHTTSDWQSRAIPYSIVCVSKIVIALVLLLNQKSIAKFISSKSADKENIAPAD